MEKSILFSLITVLGLSLVVDAGATSTACPGLGTANYIPNYTSKAQFQKQWPSMVAQTVKDTSQIFCAQPTNGQQAGALQLQLPSFLGGTGTLQHVASVQSASQVYWVPSPNNNNVGDYKGTVSVILHLDPIFGGGTIPFLFHVENYIDENGNLCLGSSDGATQPNTVNFDFGPGMMWYFVRAANAMFSDGTTFFFDTVNLYPDGTTKNFAYFRNAVADPNQFPFLTPTNIPNEFLEVYYTKMNTSDCHAQ